MFVWFRMSCSSSQDLDLFSSAPDASQESNMDTLEISSCDGALTLLSSEEEPPEPEPRQISPPIKAEPSAEEPQNPEVSVVMTSLDSVAPVTPAPPDPCLKPADDFTHTPIHRTSTVLSRKLSSGSISSHHVRRNSQI